MTASQHLERPQVLVFSVAVRCQHLGLGSDRRSQGGLGLLPTALVAILEGNRIGAGVPYTFLDEDAGWLAADLFIHSPGIRGNRQHATINIFLLCRPNRNSGGCCRPSQYVRGSLRVRFCPANWTLGETDA